MTKFSPIFYFKILARYSAIIVQHHVNGDELNNGQNGFSTHYSQNNGPIFLGKKSGAGTTNVPLHDVDPATAVDCPVGQSEQVVWPVVDVKVPTAHAVHVCPEPLQPAEQTNAQVLDEIKLAKNCGRSYDTEYRIACISSFIENTTYNIQHLGLMGY